MRSRQEDRCRPRPVPTRRASRSSRRRAARLGAGSSHEAIVDVARAVVAAERDRLGAGEGPRAVDALADDVVARLGALGEQALAATINATGVIVHTNLGRAPWPRAAIQAAEAAARDYLLLELDRDSGRRGARFRAAEEHLVALTGAQDAIVTNNNAAAVALAVGLAGRGGGVVVGRGELVEIGGGVRIPEIIRRAGAKLIEVGTTNRTRAEDYELPLAEGRARVVLRVHPSNFRQTGFTETPDPRALADLAHGQGAIVVDDLGSGALLPTERYGLAHEPMPAERLADGADVVTFSGDKLVGGPQAGLVVGRADLIARIRRDPLARAMRPDKVTLAAVAATLGLYRAGRAETEIPVWRMIAATPDAIRERAEALADRLAQRGRGRADRGDRRGRFAAGRDAAIVWACAQGWVGRSNAWRAAAGEPGSRRPDRKRSGDPRPADRRSGARRGPGAGDRCGPRGQRADVTVVVGTAGHIDHGKTTLLRALTGIDADRLPEERRRGMTIDVGYAHLELPDGSQLDFVDVPGHDKLVGNMLVGAGEIDAALLVVAADDGPRPQTLEHLELLDALGIADGLAVVTKADAVTPERATEVAAATRDLLDRTALAGASVCVVSASTGAGLDEFRAALVALVGRVVARGLPAGPARLAIDRVFSVKGRGVVVTGTLRGGPLERGMALRLLPGDREARVREVQVHGRTVDRVAGGGRTALNLGGVGAEDLHRGMVLAAPAASTSPEPAARRPGTTDRVLVALRPVTDLGGRAPPIPHDRMRVRFHSGTEQVGAVVGRSGRDAAALPGGEVAAILRLERPVAVAAADRFVLRRPSPGGTLAGGRILDALPPRGVSRRRTTPERLVALAAAATDDAVAAARLDLHGAIPGNPVRLADDLAAALSDDVVADIAASGAWLPIADVRARGALSLRRSVTLSSGGRARCRDDRRRWARRRRPLGPRWRSDRSGGECPSRPQPGNADRDGPPRIGSRCPCASAPVGGRPRSRLSARRDSGARIGRSDRPPRP